MEGKQKIENPNINKSETFTNMRNHAMNGQGIVRFLRNHDKF